MYLNPLNLTRVRLLSGRERARAWVGSNYVIPLTSGWFGSQILRRSSIKRAHCRWPPVSIGRHFVPHLDLADAVSRRLPAFLTGCVRFAGS